MARQALIDGQFVDVDEQGRPLTEAAPPQQAPAQPQQQAQPVQQQAQAQAQPMGQPTQEGGNFLTRALGRNKGPDPRTLAPGAVDKTGQSQRILTDSIAGAAGTGAAGAVITPAMGQLFGSSQQVSEENLAAEGGGAAAKRFLAKATLQALPAPLRAAGKAAIGLGGEGAAMALYQKLKTGEVDPNGILLATGVQGVFQGMGNFLKSTPSDVDSVMMRAANDLGADFSPAELSENGRFWMRATGRGQQRAGLVSDQINDRLEKVFPLNPNLDPGVTMRQLDSKLAEAAEAGIDTDKILTEQFGLNPLEKEAFRTLRGKGRNVLNAQGVLTAAFGTPKSVGQKAVYDSNLAAVTALRKTLSPTDFKEMRNAWIQNVLIKGSAELGDQEGRVLVKGAKLAKTVRSMQDSRFYEAAFGGDEGSARALKAVADLAAVLDPAAESARKGKISEIAERSVYYLSNKAMFAAGVGGAVAGESLGLGTVTAVGGAAGAAFGLSHMMALAYTNPAVVEGFAHAVKHGTGPQVQKAFRQVTLAIRDEKEADKTGIPVKAAPFIGRF